MNSDRKDIVIVRADGTVAVREVLVFSCYFVAPHSEIAKSVAEAIAAYVTLVSFEALSLFYDNEGEPQRLTPESLADLFQLRFFGPYRTPNANIILASQNDDVRDYFLWYNGKALDLNEFKDEVGYLWLWMPRAAYLGRQAKVLDFLTSLVDRLPITFAYVSLGLAERHKQTMQGLATRYSGLDIAQPLCVSADLDQKAAGCYWINFFGKSLADSCGGLTELRRSLPTPIAVEELRGGKVRVVLGKEPELGDTNRRDLLPSYRLLAKFLDERGLLHIPDRVVYFVDQQGLADKDAMVRWHRRFLDEE